MTLEKPLRADARRNRDALIRAAREIFAAEGTDVPFEDFARRAGVGAGTLYRHFPTREALATAVYRAEVSALSERALELSEAHSPHESLAMFLREMVEHMYVHRGLGRTFAAFVEADGGAIAGDGSELEDAVTALVKAGIETGEIREGVSAGALMLALHGVAFASTRSASRTEADAVIQLLIDGLRRP